MIDLVKEFKDHEKTYRLLNDIIPDFDPSYSTTAFFECNMLEKQIKKFMPFQENTNLEIKGFGGNAYFKINFKEDVIQFVPHELKHLRQLIHSSTYKREDSQYTYGFIPSYIPNINHLTLRVTQNEYEINQEISKLKEIDVYNVFTWDNKYDPMSIDTLNRFSKQHSEILEGISSNTVREKIRQCFELCYWYLPDIENLGKVLFFDKTGGFGFISRDTDSSNLHFSSDSVSGEIKKGDLVEYEIGQNKKGLTAKMVRKKQGTLEQSIVHNFLYDRPKSIADIVVVRKTIAKIEQINPKERTITLVDRNFGPAYNAKVTYLTFNGKDILPKTLDTYITKNVASGLEIGDIINCIVCKTINKNKVGHEFSRFCIIGRFDKKINDDLRPFVGLLAWKKMQNIEDSNLCKIDEISKFKNDFFAMLKLIDDSLLKKLQTSNSLDKIFDITIQSLFPLFVMKENFLYHNPPALISYLACYQPQVFDSKQMMDDIAILVDNFLNNFYKWGHDAQMKLNLSQFKPNLRFTEESARLQNVIDLNHLLQYMPQIVRRLVYSRLLSQHWRQWNVE